MTTKTYRIYGREGHRQGQSFCSSFVMEWGNEKCEVLNSDKTGTNDYTKLRITAASEERCEHILDAQISDGIFEDCRIGKVELVEDKKLTGHDVVEAVKKIQAAVEDCIEYACYTVASWQTEKQTDEDYEDCAVNYLCEKYTLPAGDMTLAKKLIHTSFAE